MDLPVGLYEVSAVLEDGQRHSQLVQIKEGESTPVELGLREPDQVPESRSLVESPDLPRSRSLRYTQKVESLPVAGIEAEPELVAQLLEVSGAWLKHETRSLWVFACKSDLDSVPTALFRINDRRVRISLPISPEREFPHNSCVVKVEETRTGAHASAWISSERTVANALQNMLSSGYVLRAADVADDAVDLLRYKYSDPTGAALGALVLHKVGRLEKRPSWVKNLARDFDWLPDGKVMLALLLQNDESTVNQALELALQASEQRMLYTESYSLLLDLLRRWPSDAGRADRKGAIGKLASLSPCVDWESICLSHVVEGGG